MTPYWLSTAIVTDTAKSDLRHLIFHSSVEACLTQASPGNFKSLAGLSSFPESLGENLFLFHFAVPDLMSNIPSGRELM